MSGGALHEAVLAWYDEHARNLPWRTSDRTPWGVLVSEIMLQQTPVARVEPVWRDWMQRWPKPAALAADEPAEAIRAWGRLGYPRRALRLHAAAVAIVREHGGDVPGSYQALLELPGVGDYTAAAVASFAFGRRHVVLDTNVRRVLARAVSGRAAAPTSPRASERTLAESLVPVDDAPLWAVAVMELGAVVCVARTPRCSDCPIVASCAWRLGGYPPDDETRRRTQPWAGTDRQVRGRLMAVIREADKPVPKAVLDQVWPDDPAQRERALDGLVADGLVEPLAQSRFRLPTRNGESGIAQQ